MRGQKESEQGRRRIRSRGAKRRSCGPSTSRHRRGAQITLNQRLISAMITLPVPSTYVAVRPRPGHRARPPGAVAPRRTVSPT
eukprot:750205-Hanusia_phi.AAC.4